jgi:hypothetical protein
MDPYLEQRWPEVHASLIVYARNQINRQLPSDLQANIEENLSVRVDFESDRGIRPDVHIAQDGGDAQSQASASTATVAEPLVVPRAAYPERHVEIVHHSGRVVTAIEFVSPWNKIGLRNREQYARKQMDYLSAGINLVEIDLVRQGEYVLAATLSHIPRFEPTPYLVCVYRNEMPDQFELYRAALDVPLPTIAIPLRFDEADVVLELQRLIDDCYQDGRYDRIDYQVDPQPPFDAQHTAWIDTRLREQGRRK